LYSDEKAKAFVLHLCLRVYTSLIAKLRLFMKESISFLIS